MAYLYRLIALCSLCLLSLSASAATYFKYYPYVNPLASQPRFATPAAACTYMATAIWGVAGPGSATLAYGNTYNCANNTGGHLGQIEGTPVSLTCTAPTVATFTGSGSAATWTCVNPADVFCNTKTGQPVKTSWTTTAPSLSSRTICHSQGLGTTACNVTVEADFCGTSDGGTVHLCHGSGTFGTGSCTASPTPEVPPTSPAPESSWPTPPPPGTCPGQVNGVTVNVPCSSTETKGTKTTSENDGAGNVTNKSESKTTVCTGVGSCTTTTTTTTTVNGGAPTTTTKTTTEAKGKFCADNPGSKECGDGDGSSFGGSCASGFVCEGDAVQCAHAKETHLQNCKLNKDTPERQLYESSKGDDADFDNDDVVNVGPSSFSQAPILGAASCISDKSITVMGSPVSLPFSRVCEYLSMLGNVLMAVGFLLSGRIIMRG